MQLTINGKEYGLNFGVRFVRELDKTIGASIKGINFGMGVAKALVGLGSYDSAVLSDVIYAATAASKKRPTAKEVDDFIDEDGTDLDSLFKQIPEEMRSANAVKAATKNMKA